jgi:hypothetical protein
MKRDPRKPLPVTQAVIANDRRDEPLAPTELAQMLGVQPARIHEAQSRLRRARRVRASERQFSRVALPGRADGSPEPPRDVTGECSAPLGLNLEKLLAGLECEAVLAPQERRQLLSRIARHAPAAIKIQALKALEEMDRQQGRQVGPPDPMTDEELTARVAVVLSSAGPHLGHAAIKKALDVWKVEQSASQSLPSEEAPGRIT